MNNPRSFWWFILVNSTHCEPEWCHKDMMTSSNGNIFRVTGPLWGEFTGDRWIPHTKASDAELWCFLWSAPWINDSVNNREAGDLRRHRAHYDVIVTDGDKLHHHWFWWLLVAVSAQGYQLIATEHKNWTALVQVVACCHTAPIEFLWHSHEGNFTGNVGYVNN